MSDTYRDCKDPQRVLSLSSSPLKPFTTQFQVVEKEG